MSVRENTILIIDDNEEKYLYFVRSGDDNEIFVTVLNDDLYSIKNNITVQNCRVFSFPN
jgi:hypothetical protein